MAASLLERIPVDEITAQARQARPGRMVLLAVAAVLFGLGWLTARGWLAARACLGAACLALAWGGTAVKVGWQAGQLPRAGTRVSRGAA